MRATGADQQGSLAALEVFGHRPHGAPAGGLLWEGPVKYPAPRPLPPQKACPLRRWDCLPVRSRQRCPSDHRSLRSRLPGCAQRSGSTFRGSGWEFLSSPAGGWDFKREHGPLSLCLGRILHCRCDTLQYVDFVCVPGSKQDDDADLCAILTLLLHPEASPQPPPGCTGSPPTSLTSAATAAASFSQPPRRRRAVPRERLASTPSRCRSREPATSRIGAGLHRSPPFPFPSLPFSFTAPPPSTLLRKPPIMPATERPPQTLYDKVLSHHVVDEKLDGTILLYIGMFALLTIVAVFARGH